MTRARIKTLVREYQSLLRLEDWDLDVDFDTELEGTRNAEVEWTWDYHEARVRFDARQWREWSDDQARRFVVHELLHLVMRDLAVCAMEHYRRLPKAARGLAHDRWDHELEGVVERLAGVVAG